MVWHRIYEVTRNDVVFGECSVPGWRCGEDGVGAQVIFTVSAVAAMATRNAGFDRYSLSDLDIRHFVADFDYGAYFALVVVIRDGIWPHTRAFVP